MGSDLDRRAYIMPADGPQAAIFEQALHDTLERTLADGGAIATRDESRNSMVLRVRQVHPRLLQESATSILGQNFNQIDEAATTVLPVTHLWRLYKPGERLIGTVWHLGEPLMLSDADVRGLPSGSAPEDPPAAWHLAVPIFAVHPNGITPPGEMRQVIGVIALYVVDPQWRFTQNQLLLTQAMAQNLAQALQLSVVYQQQQRQQRLISLLQELTSNIPFQGELDHFYEQFFERIYRALTGVVDTTAFAVAMLPERMSNSRPLEPVLNFYSVIEENQPLGSERHKIDELPWWNVVQHGKTVEWITEEQRRAIPELETRIWGSRRYMESQLFVPIKAASVVIGSLLVSSTRTSSYTASHVFILEMVGRFLGLAIENSQFRRTHRAISGQTESERTLALLNNSLLGLNSSLNIQDIIRDLVEQTSELTRGHVCVYLNYDQHNDELVILDAAQNKDHGLFTEAINTRLPIGNRRTRLALEGQTIAIEDATSEYERDDIIGHIFQQYHIKDLLLIPVIYTESIIRHNRVMGLLAVFLPDQGIFFTPTEEMNLLALGRVAASALNNASLYAQLRELDTLKDEFILTASHEFRTPMSAIQGFSWLIQRRTDTMTPDQAKHWAGEISRATEQLKDMLDTLTEAWRTKNIQQFTVGPVQLRQVCATAQEISSGVIAANQDTVANDVPEHICVLAEADRLRHVISNLLTNAAKYSSPQSTIQIISEICTSETILAMPRERGAHDDEDFASFVKPDGRTWIVTHVNDRGIGISQANQKRLFAKFIRLELTTSVRGTGLGLYICRRYIESMGGEIWVNSVLGQGSTFSFCLPVCPSAEAAVPDQ